MIYIKETSELEQVKTLYGKPELGCDTETTGLDPFTSDLRLLQFSDGEQDVVIDVKKVGREAAAHYVRPILESPDTVKVLHNAKFDQKFIKHQLGIDIERPFDSYLASLLIEGGISQPKGFHGLEQTLDRFTKIQVTKDEQMSDWSGELSDAQLQYACGDVHHMPLLRDAMIEMLKKLGLVRVAKLEFDAILPIAWLELSGFYLDFEQWMVAANDNLAKANESADKIYAQLNEVIQQGSLFGASTINLDSHQQIEKYFTEIGVPIPKDDTGKYQTKAYLLEAMADKYPIVRDLLDYRGYMKGYTSFGEKFGEFINPVTGRIHANFMQIGAETGRLAPNQPNLNQIPQEPAQRNCFKAEEGNTLISDDYSQEELRILADFSGDKKFKALFASGMDFHTATAMQLFNLKADEVKKEDRDLAKRLNFGLTYGIGVKKFALQARISEAEARLVRNTYFNTFKTVNRWINYQKMRVLETRSARTASGRLMNFEFDIANGFETSKAQRNAVNGPIQGTGADILKRALKLYYDASKPYHAEIKLVNIIHDEINIEVPKEKAEEHNALLKKCMIQAGNDFVKDVEIKVDTKICDFWNKG